MGVLLIAAWVIGIGTPGSMFGAPVPSCEKVIFAGEVNAGEEWKGSLGEGWVFRVIPIDPGQAAYSGWDLVVDRDEGAGFPDALLLATPPYGSINEREIGTTFGLRAQDAIGWNPRSFRFVVDPASLRRAQQLFRDLPGASPSGVAGKDADTAHKLMQETSRSAAGQFRILDARLTPGVADAAPFAETWAAQSARTPHELDTAPSTKPTAMGTLNWIRFNVTLWLPAGWKTPPSLRPVRGSCSE
jgi:hypothetical protein